MGHTFFRYYQTQPATCYLPNTNKRKKQFTYRYLVTSYKKTTAHNYLSTSLHGLQTCWYPDDLYINSLLSLYFITKPIITYCPLFLTIIKCHAWQFVYVSRKYIQLLFVYEMQIRMDMFSQSPTKTSLLSSLSVFVIIMYSSFYKPG